MDRNLSVVWNNASLKHSFPEKKFTELCVDFLLKKSDWLTKPTGVAEFTKIAKERLKKKKDAEEKAKAAEAAAKKAAEEKKKASSATPKPSQQQKPPQKPSTNEVIDLTDLAGSDPSEKKEPVDESKGDACSDGEGSDSDKGEVPVGNGGTTDKYTWTQSLGEVEVRIPVPALRGKAFDVQIKAKHIRVAVKGKDPIVDADLHDEVDTEDSMWSLAEERGVEGKILTLQLQKKKGMNWWNKVCVGDPEINTKKIEPENSKLDDLDKDTRQTVEKMMFDQRQKQMGKPTSKEREQNAMLKKFMAQHPEMDFSNAKIGGMGGKGGGMPGMMGGMPGMMGGMPGMK